MPNGISVPIDIYGDWTVLVNTSICVVAYKIDKYMVSLYLDYKTAAADWTEIATLPDSALPFYTHYMVAFWDIGINGYKLYNFNKDTKKIYVKGNTGSTPTIHCYPIV